MYNQMIRKEILIVEDIVKPINDMTVVFDEMGLEDYIFVQKSQDILVFQ